MGLLLTGEHHRGAGTSPHGLVGQPDLRIGHNSLRPSIASIMVASSTKSSSVPTGTPMPIRETRTPNGFKAALGNSLWPGLRKWGWWR